MGFVRAVVWDYNHEEEEGQDDDIFYDTPQYESDTVYPLTLNSGEYFILGDQRGNAKDSRYFGAVKDKEIKGRVITVLRRSDI